MTPIGCAHCGVTRRLHDATDHHYQVPDLKTMRDRADDLKTQRRAAA